MQLPQSKWLTITQHDIDTGVRCYPDACPMALAAQRGFDKIATANETYVFVYDDPTPEDTEEDTEMPVWRGTYTHNAGWFVEAVDSDDQAAIRPTRIKLTLVEVKA